MRLPLSGRPFDNSDFLYSGESGQNKKKHKYPKFRINFSTKIVSVPGTNNYTFQSATANEFDYDSPDPVPRQTIDSSTRASTFRAESIAFSSKIGDNYNGNEEVVDDSQTLRILLPGCDVTINSFCQILSKLSNVEKLDLKVYLIPSNAKMSLLATYLAVRDTLYDSLIFKPFLDNPYFRAIKNSNFDGYDFQDFVSKSLPLPERLIKENKSKST